MDAHPPLDLKAFVEQATATLASIKPALAGMREELKRQARVSHDHEDFLIHEFRDLTRAIDGLTAQLARVMP